LPTFSSSSAGVKDVIVTNPDGTSLVNANAQYTVIAQYVSVTANGTVPIAVTPNRFSSNKSTATVSTNSPGGYVLSLQASSASLTKAIAPTSMIPTLPGYMPATPLSASATSSQIGNTSFWVFRTDGLGNLGSGTVQETNTTSTAYSWASVPTTDTVIRAGTATDDLTTNTPQTTETWFGATAAISRPAGVYTTTITYTVSTNLP
jgi:hypothetical protein